MLWEVVFEVDEIENEQFRLQGKLFVKLVGFALDDDSLEEGKHPLELLRHG